MDSELTKGQEDMYKALSGFYNNDVEFKGINELKLFGLAGTGKTWVMAYWWHDLGEPSDVVFIAPTGRASANLYMKGVPCKTVHAFAYDLDMNGKEKLEFKLKDEIEECEYIVVEEASMCGDKMVDDLRSFGKKIVWVGDPGQMPPVGYRESKVMRDPDVFMMEVVRQKRDNPILMVANSIYKGEPIKYGSYGKSMMVTKKYTMSLDTLMKADQVITASNKERHSINNMVRRESMRYDAIPMVGDKLLCTKNKWSCYVGGVPLINGMLGECRKIKVRGNDTALIMFKPEFTEENIVVEADLLPFYGRSRAGISDLATFDFGYAITLHKAQGSEWSKIAVRRDIVLPGIKEKNWLYTAITRAVDKLGLEL